MSRNLVYSLCKSEIFSQNISSLFFTQRFKNGNRNDANEEYKKNEKHRKMFLFSINFRVFSFSCDYIFHKNLNTRTIR